MLDLGQGVSSTCNSLSFLTDLLDAKAFSPIKIDIQGNIECLQTKLNSDPAVYATLGSIVSREAGSKKAQLVTSGSNALLWITRR